MRSKTRKILAMVLIAGGAGLSGCYERVVGAKGIGAQGVAISEPNLPDDSKTQVRTQKKTVRLKDAPSR